jgi:uncharacterized repeat protein (TIGR03803 family)
MPDSPNLQKGERVMQINAGNNTGKRSSAPLAWGFAVLCAALTVAPAGASAAPTETVLHAFTGGTDGSQPAAGLIADSAGNLYGTTAGGGIDASRGGGVVFKLSPSGTETVLHTYG